MNVTYLDEDVDEILNECIDLENGFRGYLMFLRPRLTNSHSKQILDLLIRLLFQKPVECVFRFRSKDFPTHEIPLDIGPHDLLERIVEYETQHKIFYISLTLIDFYAEAHETFNGLVAYKTGQINETLSVLNKMELTV